MQLGDRTAQRHQAIAKTGGIVSSDYWDFTPGQRVMTREGFAGVVTAVSDGPVPGNEEYEVKLDGGLGGGAYAPGELQPLDPPVAAEAALQVEAAGWRRFSHGEFADGWINSDGSIILEKGAPGEGAESRGIWTWIIWLKADPSEYTVDQFGAYSNTSAWHGPLRKVGDDWYIDTGYEGWGLEDAKANAAHVLERRGHTAAVTVKDYEGQTGNRDHVTRHEDGTLPTSAIAHLQGVKGERPGEHRNKKGAAWEEFKADIAANGIQNPIFITVDYRDEPRISEGNHRRDAAVELGLDEVPVEIRYFGHAEQQGTVGQRTGAVEKVRIYACPDHAPIGVAKEPDNDAQRTCSACGRTGYNVQPFMLPADVVERGWRGADFGTHRQSAVQADVRTAADDYPELGNILEERPDHEPALPVTASLTKEGRKLIPVSDESEISRPGFEVEAGWGERLFGPAINRMYEHMPPQFQTVEQGYPSSYDWCRFRRSSHCWYSYQIDQQKSQELGRVVWIPQDRGLCPRPGWDEQKACPIAEPGPHSHDPNAKVDATLPYDAGGQRVSKVALQPKPLQQPATTPVKQPGRISPNYMTPTKTRPDNPNATEFGRLSPTFQDATRARVEAQTPDARFGPLTHERVVKNLMMLYQNAKNTNQEAINSGRTWYNHANEESRGVATAAGVSERHGYGMMAALSPRCDWDENMAQAHYMAGVLTAGQPVQMSRVALRQANAKLRKYAKDYDTDAPIPKIQNGDDWSKLHPLAVACALYGKGKNDDRLLVPTKLKKDGQPYRATWNNGVKNIVKAVRIQRGEDPDQVLSGHKVRSFFNNIMDPDNGGGFNDVTIDTHAVSAASHAMMAAGSKKLKQIFDAGGNTHENTQGAYAYFADAYREANQRLQAAGEPKMSPNQFQAIIWLHWRHITRHLDRNQNINIFPKYKTVKKPAVAAVAAQDQTQPSQDASGRLDPWFVPEGEHHDPDHDPEGEEDLPDDWPYHEQDEDNLKLASEAALVSEAFLAEGRWHLTAAWRDVREKAKRIKTEGGVRIIAAPTHTDTSVVAEVRGDHNIYETTITREPGKHAVAMWTCGCAWASYSWGRSGRWKRYEGRMCSHALALVYEVQAKGMFGRTVDEDREQPVWRMDPTIPVITPQNYPKPKKRRASLQVEAAFEPGDQVEIRVPDDHPLMNTKWWPLSPHYDGRYGRHHTKVTGTVNKVYKNGKAAVGVHQMYNRSEDGVTTQNIEIEHLHPLHESSLRPVRTDAELQVAPAVLTAQALMEQGYSPNDTLDTLIDMGLPNAVGMVAEALAIKPFKARVRGWVRTVVQLLPGGGALLDTGHEVDASELTYPTYDPTLGLDPTLRDSVPHISTTVQAAVEMGGEANRKQGEGPVYYHGSGRDSGRALTGDADWDRRKFVSHDPEVAKLYGRSVNRLQMTPDTKVLVQDSSEYKKLAHGINEPGLLGHHSEVVRRAEKAGYDVAEFHRPHDFIGHVIINQHKIQSTTPHTAQGADTKGVMICLKPPERICNTLADLGTEPADNIHITLAYFGGVDEVDGDALHAAVRTFAEKAPSLIAEVSGLGTFENGEENVLMATWDIPGIDRFRSDLVDHCRGFDQVAYNNHGFTPHATLSYGDEPFRKLPALPDDAKERFAISEIWLTIGNEWAPYSLQPMGATVADLASDWAEALTEGYETGEVDADAITWFAPSEAGQALGEQGAFSARVINYDGRPLYHGTNAALRVGDTVEPSVMRGGGSRFVDHDYYDSTVVYSSDKPHLAGRFAYGAVRHGGGEPHVYQVRPIGTIYQDPEAETGFGTDQWVSNLAEVVREVDKSEWGDPRLEKRATPDEARDADYTPEQRDPEPVVAELHDEPEPALPETDSADGDEDEDAEIKPGDAKLGWLMSGEGGQDKSNSDIAAMARQFLKEGAKAFTPAEQRQIIDEGEGALAANFDALDITGTHYEALEAALAAEEDDEELLFG